MEQSEVVIWEGKTWPVGIISPLICSSTKWRITTRRIDYISGICGSEENTLDLRRITDLKYKRSCVQLLVGRGTLTIFSNDNTDPVLKISTWGMKRTYRKLKDAWSAARIVASVQL
ncbi:9438_t:CDS:2 [Ambispora gerdemannii]|uniref:9438_t:CDS:1 n=1 Tax=Ambispora gerdemannii TaxID=144530 RepID=A0A9N8ZX46_9GLOM|nr:9438_t:CDS:2 [Ambispora gerdemannii]